MQIYIRFFIEIYTFPDTWNLLYILIHLYRVVALIAILLVVQHFCLIWFFVWCGLYRFLLLYLFLYIFFFVSITEYFFTIVFGFIHYFFVSVRGYLLNRKSTKKLTCYTNIIELTCHFTCLHLNYHFFIGGVKYVDPHRFCFSSFISW